MKKYELIYVETCLPDYWSGHHLPTLQVGVWQHFTLRELKDELKGELNLLWEYYDQQGVDFDAAEAAINALTLRDGLDPATHKLFEDVPLPVTEKDDWVCYAYFVLEEVDHA